MVEQQDQRNPHIILEGFAETMPFQRPLGGGGNKREVPERDRSHHGALLLSQINDLKAQSETASVAHRAAGFEGGFGLQVEFESFPEIELAFESLARERSGIELLNVRHDGQSYYATVFVPDGKLDLFEGLIQKYLERNLDRNGNPRDNRKLIDAIQEIRVATLRALWTDDTGLFPTENDESIWWEVWLPIRGDRAASISRFRNLAQAQNLEVSEGELTFPERTVLLVHGSASQMTQSTMTLNSIAELRRAKETAEFFASMQPNEQSDWLDNLFARTNYAGVNMTVPYVCLLDTGVNNGHQLLLPALSTADLHTVEPGWGAADLDGHGTAMAGLALAGNITNLLATSEPILIGHRLESVKLLPQDGATGNDAQHHGYLTIEAVSRPEIAAPNRDRVFGMAVTARDNRDRGRPSAWSAAVDSLASDAGGQGAAPRLLVISAGNISDPDAWSTYPDSNGTDGIHDPGQAWNALTVGAFTDLFQITESDAGDYQPIAPVGGLSPFSTTSNTWQPDWPLKPDVLFEGGNVGRDAAGAFTMDSLSLLTTHHLPNDRLFTTTQATSAATALAARMAAQLMAVYPSLWPESIRALMVHSAEWTDCMRKMFLPEGSSLKSAYQTLVRHCGFGVPDLNSALYSVANSLTMVEEEQLHPFKYETGRTKLRDMNFHKLPWPLTELEALGQTQVEMRVTLSYFIEPNPSARGFSSKYSYQSHALRFDVKRPSESEQNFRARINSAARDEEERTHTGGDDPAWVIGPQNRHKGSLHSDIWRGSAADLASRGILAVYPASGWWKTRQRLERYDRLARYSLIVSIRAPEVDVDLYSAITNQIATLVPVES